MFGHRPLGKPDFTPCRVSTRHLSYLTIQRHQSFTLHRISAGTEFLAPLAEQTGEHIRMQSSNNMQTTATSSQPGRSRLRARHLKSGVLCAVLTTSLLGGCVSSEGDRRTATLTKEEPFQSLRGKRVTLLRPIRIQKTPTYVNDSGSSSANASDDIAWIVDVHGTAGASNERLDNGDVEKRIVGRTLPAGTVIELKRFSLVRNYALAWLPGQDTSLPWYPGRGLFPYPTRFYAEFTSETASAMGRPLGAEVVLAYRWGCGPHLWAAPWEPKGKEPVFVGDMGRSFKLSR